MKVPVKWLRSMVDPAVTTKELSHRLTMAGLEVEKIETIGAEWDKIFVAKVIEVMPHPDADRLVLADVDAGEHRLTVVTGAPNIAAGQTVALAIAGANLIDGHNDSGQRKVLKPTKMRGIMSEGMVCSEKELGLSDEHEGILVLDDDAPKGMPLADWLGDEVMEFEITPNLVHNFSVLGIAREVAALCKLQLKQPAVADLTAIAEIPELVEIRDLDLCPRYMGVVFEAVEIGPSPEWLARLLTNAGVRPISNVVDVTNFVMLEIGQPLHAFDRDRLAEGRIVVRRAHPDEQMETLDHIQRNLGSETLVIADAEKAVAVAGVMGGVYSEVADDTTTVLLEGASFDMKSVRHTSRALKLRTDASARFERGLDPNLVQTAMARATQLMLEVIPGARVTGRCDVYPEPVTATELRMPYSRIHQVLGVDIPHDQSLDVLGRLEFQPRIEDGGILALTVPTYRHDVTIADDVVEEVARMIGYETLPSTLPSGRRVPVRRDLIFQLQKRIRSVANALGISEAVTYVTVSDEMLAPFQTNDGETVGVLIDVPLSEMLSVRNPLQSGRSRLRITMIPSLLEAVAANLKHTPSVGLFEFARLFQPVAPDSLPMEREVLAIAIAGNREPLSVYSNSGLVDFFDLKGVVETILRRAGAGGATFKAWSHPALHPGRTARIELEGKLLGVIGELRPDVGAKFDLEGTRVTVAELDVQALLESEGAQRREVRVPRFLPARQDYAIVVDETTSAADVERTLRWGAGPLLTSLDLFDIYRGSQIGEGKKSLAYRATFTAPDRALTDDDLVKVRKRIEKTILSQVNGTLRA